MAFARKFSSGSILTRVTLEILVVTAATLTVSFGLANLAGQPVFQASQNAGTQAKTGAFWSGGLMSIDPAPKTQSAALTSSSYILPRSPEVANPGPNADNVSGAAPCPSKPARPKATAKKAQAASPALSAQTAISSPLKPAAGDTQPDKPQNVAEAQPEKKAAGWPVFDKIGDYLPKADILLKPFGAVSDTVAKLIKRF